MRMIDSQMILGARNNVRAVRRAGFVLLAVLFFCVGAQVGFANTFRVVGMGAGVSSLSMNPGGGDEIRVSTGSVTGPYKLNGRTLQFFGTNEETGAAQLQALASIPEGIRQPLIVFRAIPQTLADGTVLPYSTAVVDDSRRGFPIHSVRFINTSPHALAVGFAKQSPFVLAPGQSQVVRHGALSSNTIESVQLAAANENGQWQRIGSGEVYLRRNGRHIVFLAPKSIDAVDELGPQELVLVVDMRRIPKPLPDEDDGTE